MRLDLAPTLAGALALFRRDRAVLLPLAGCFLFLPIWTLQLLVAAPPAPPAGGAGEAATLAWAQAVTAWAGTAGIWYLLAYAVLYWGQATLFTLYCDPARPDLAGALRRAGGMLPRYLLAMLLVAIPAGAGLMLFVIPGLYVIGRALLTGPLLVAERPLPAARAIWRSVTLTRGSGLTLMALAALSVLVKWLVASPFLMLDAWLRANDAGNPLALALVDAGAAAAVAAAELGLALAAVVSYRRLASTGT